MTEETRVKTFEILVNNRAVIVDDRSMTGREILEAAQLDPSMYQLFEIRGESGTLDPIGLDQTVHVHPKQRFTATTGDEPSSR